MQLTDFLKHYSNVNTVSTKYSNILVSSILDPHYKLKQRLNNLYDILDVRYDVNDVDNYNFHINEYTVAEVSVMTQTLTTLTYHNDVEQEYINYIDKYSINKTMTYKDLYSRNYTLEKLAHSIFFNNNPNNYTCICNQAHKDILTNVIVNNKLRNIIYIVPNDNIQIYVNTEYDTFVFNCQYTPITVIKVNLI
jgi:hypothetical protein